MRNRSSQLAESRRQMVYARLREAAAGAGRPGDVHVRPIPPSLEDVFVTLSRREARA